MNSKISKISYPKILLRTGGCNADNYYDYVLHGQVDVIALLCSTRTGG